MVEAPPESTERTKGFELTVIWHPNRGRGEFKTAPPCAVDHRAIHHRLWSF